MVKKIKKGGAKSKKSKDQKRSEDALLPPELQEPIILGGSSDAELESSDSEDGGVSGHGVSEGASEMIQRAEAAMARVASKGPAGSTSKGQEKLKKKKKKKTVSPVEAASTRNDGQIYLSQLPFSVSEEVLRKDFEKFGEVTRFFFHRNASNKPAGTACLFYKDPAVADKVLLLDGIDYKGRAIRVRRRQPRKPSAGKQQAPQFKPRGAKRKAPAPAPTQDGSGLSGPQKEELKDQSEGKKKKKVQKKLRSS